MNSSVRMMRAFSAELMKIASGIKYDADVRKLLSERQGEEYLDGGRLLTNDATEAPYSQKMAYSYTGARAGLNSGSFDVLSSKKKKNNTYQKARDYAGSALKGGLTGLGILGAANAMRGRFGAPSGPEATRKAMTAARRAFGAGAGAAVIDRSYRHDDLPGQDKAAFAVSPNNGSSFKSPAAEMAQSSQVGSFRGGIVHNTGVAPKSPTMGQKFRIP